MVIPSSCFNARVKILIQGWNWCCILDLKCWLVFWTVTLGLPALCYEDFFFFDSKKYNVEIEPQILMDCIFISLNSKYFVISSCFFNQWIIGKYIISFLNIWNFSPEFFLLLISNLIPTWSENIRVMTWLLFNVLRLLLWP